MYEVVHREGVALLIWESKVETGAYRLISEKQVGETVLLKRNSGQTSGRNPSREKTLVSCG